MLKPSEIIVHSVSVQLVVQEYGRLYTDNENNLDFYYASYNKEQKRSRKNRYFFDYMNKWTWLKQEIFLDQTQLVKKLI